MFHRVCMAMAMNAGQRKWRQHSDAVCCFPLPAGKSWGRTRRSWLLCSVGWRRSRRCWKPRRSRSQSPRSSYRLRTASQYTTGQPTNRPIKKRQPNRQPTNNKKTQLACRAGVLASTRWNPGRHLRLGNRESLGWVQQGDSGCGTGEANWGNGGWSLFFVRG